MGGKQQMRRSESSDVEGGKTEVLNKRHAKTGDKNLFNKELIFPEPLRPNAQDAEARMFGVFAIPRFSINENGHAVISGNRYELSGKELPGCSHGYAKPWGSRLFPKRFTNPPTRRKSQRRSPPRDLSRTLREFLTEQQLSDDGEVRLRHGHGHTQEEMFAIKHEHMNVCPIWLFILKRRTGLPNLSKPRKHTMPV